MTATLGRARQMSLYADLDNGTLIIEFEKETKQVGLTKAGALDLARTLMQVAEMLPEPPETKGAA